MLIARVFGRKTICSRNSYSVQLPLLMARYMHKSQQASAEDTLYIPSLSYRTGPFAGAGTFQFANGFADYFTMLNERDGGIGGAKIVH